jgi:hypothetical protein
VWHFKLNFTVLIWTAMDMKIAIMCFKKVPLNASTLELEGM